MVIGCKGSKDLVTIDPYNSFESDIYKNIVVSGGACIMLIDAWCEDRSENEETILVLSQ